jgi:hypothetical protein
MSRSCSLDAEVTRKTEELEELVESIESRREDLEHKYEVMTLI